MGGCSIFFSYNSGCAHLAVFPAGKQEDCLIQPEEFKYLKFSFRSVINWCCDTDGKSNVAPAVMQAFFFFCR